MEAVLARKTVNALVPDAEPGFVANFLVDLAGPAGADVAIESVLEGFRKAMGGLWVGGTATLHEGSIAFKPNLVNRLVHKGDYSIAIPLSGVTDVSVRTGMVTKIIDIGTGVGTLALRCYGAEKFAGAIRDQKARVDAAA